jgi:uncharacterized protein with HEPN domain
MTVERDARVRLEDMLQNLRLAREFCAELSSPGDLAADPKARYAVLHALEIVGEAAKHVPPEIRALAPEIPWSDIAGMRDRLIHGYGKVDLDLVWRTAKARAPATEPLVRALLTRLDAEAAAGE